MPTDPNAPQGPSAQQPTPTIDPAVSDAFNRISAAIDKSAESADRIAEALKRIPSVQDEITRRFKNVNLELEAMVELADNTEESIKMINAQTRSLRKGIIDTKKAEDAKTVLKAIIQAQEKIRKNLREGTQGWSDSVKIVKELENQLEEIKDTVGDLSGPQMEKLNKGLMQADKIGERMSKTFKTVTLGHLTRQVHGIGRALHAVGIGKDYAARVEKYQKYGEIPYKMQEAQRARISENKQAWREKREEALKAVQAEYGDNMANPRAQAALAKKMGIGFFRRARMSPADLAGLAGTGDKTAAVTAMEAHGTGVGGVMSKAATGLEKSMSFLGENIADMALGLAALEGALLLVEKAFDGWVQQNKAMEVAMGKGGLFTTELGGRGFTGARAGLTPEDAYTMLGLSMDRNMKIAQAIAEGGLGVQEIVRAGAQEQMTGQKVIGPAGRGFMAGGAGMIQRVAVGAGRLAGMTDAEGVGQVLKMLSQYRDTLEGTEAFFVRINKATAASGISTMKYISILDEVLGRFARMNKQLDVAVNVLGGLSKTGRIASEDLQEYFDFLTGGAAAKEQAGTPEQMFLFGRVGKEDRKKIAGEQAEAYSGLVTEAIGTPGAQGGAAIPGVFENIRGLTKEQIQAGLSGSNTNVQKFLDDILLPAVDRNKDMDATQKKSVQGLVDRIRKQANDRERWEEFAKGKISMTGMGFGAQVGGQNMVERLAMQKTALKFVMRESGVKDMGALLANPELLAAKLPIMAPLLKKFNIQPEDMYKFIGTQRLAATNRIQDAKADENMAKTLIQQLNRKGARITLKPGQSAAKFFQDEGDKQTNAVAALDETMDYWGELASKQPEKVTKLMRDREIAEAKKVGVQTQSMAEMIANAFSKWFVNIISGLEFIADHMPGSGAADRAKLKSAYVADQAAAKLPEALGNVEDRIAELGDHADTMEAAGDEKSKKQAEMDRNQIKGLQQAHDLAQAVLYNQGYMSEEEAENARILMRGFNREGYARMKVAQANAAKTATGMPSIDTTQPGVNVDKMFAAAHAAQAKQTGNVVVDNSVHQTNQYSSAVTHDNRALANPSHKSGETKAPAVAPQTPVPPPGG